MSLKKFADADLYTNKSGGQRRGRRKEFTDRRTSLDINGKTIVVLQDIPAGHKVALQDFKEGDHIIKYGAPIGHAHEAITAGSWVNEKISRPI